MALSKSVKEIIDKAIEELAEEELLAISKFLKQDQKRRKAKRKQSKK